MPANLPPPKASITNAEARRVGLAAQGFGRRKTAGCSPWRAVEATIDDIGFLQLERITWNSPAALLEKLIQYEAVHAIASWGDLRNRLDSDRRCYAFFHPRMPMEPLIFVEVALTSQLSSRPRKRSTLP